MNDFVKLNFSDSTFCGIMTEPGKLQMSIQNWQEKKIVLNFSNVIGYESFAAEGEELSHGSMDTNDSFLNTARLNSDEESLNYKCFILWSAWTSKPVFKVIAESFEENVII